MLLFAGPMILGNLQQQCYNIVDMLIVGRALGAVKSIGVLAIWWSIPIGWFLADVKGYVYLRYMCRN